MLRATGSYGTRAGQSRSIQNRWPRGGAGVGRRGHAEFALRPTHRIVFTHTVTEPNFAGQGITTRLVEWALNDARDCKLCIVPPCPRVASYLETHHQFDDALEGRSPAS